jgi:hypothetical protein
MKRTIIYVFGPKRLAAKYFANDEMAQQEATNSKALFLSIKSRFL